MIRRYKLTWHEQLQYIPPLRGHGIRPRLVEPLQLLAVKRSIRYTDQSQALRLQDRRSCRCHFSLPLFSLLCFLIVTGCYADLPIDLRREYICTRLCTACWNKALFTHTHTCMYVCIYVCMFAYPSKQQASGPLYTRIHPHAHLTLHAKHINFAIASRRLTHT